MTKKVLVNKSDVDYIKDKCKQFWVYRSLADEEDIDTRVKMSDLLRIVNQIGGAVEELEYAITGSDLIGAVERWGDDKKITSPDNTDKQFMKFVEEVFEFKEELDKYKTYRDFYKTSSKNETMPKPVALDSLKLEMGDILVTLVILSRQIDISLDECLSMAYEKIKDRKGVTQNGVFVKEEDLDD